MPRPDIPLPEALRQILAHTPALPADLSQDPEDRLHQLGNALAGLGTLFCLASMSDEAGLRNHGLADVGTLVDVLSQFALAPLEQGQEAPRAS